MHDYVPFYFAPRSPMLYAIYKSQVEGYDNNQEQIIYVVSRTDKIDQQGLDYVFTDGHAEMGFTKFYKHTEYFNKIDWNVMKSKFWFHNEEDPDRKRRRQAEFLVYKEVPIEVFLGFAVKNGQMKIRTHTPKLTRSQSLLIMLMQDYSIPGYKLSLLEIQKLAYFLQEVGEPLKLSFVKGKFGPYADNLNHVLERLDGHYIRGFGDRSRTAAIYLIKDAAKKAENFLKNDFGAFEHLKKVREIIEGYETPYGLELLSTIHAVIQEQPEIKDDAEKVIESVHKWNERKRKIFKQEHIKIALHHLNSLEIEVSTPSLE